MAKNYISLLPYNLIVHVSRILLGYDNDKINKKSLVPLINVFKDCRTYYIHNIFKLQHYLFSYSKLYYDVAILAKLHGITPPNLPRRDFEYTVVNINEKNDPIDLQFRAKTFTTYFTLYDVPRLYYTMTCAVKTADMHGDIITLIYEQSLLLDELR